MGRPLIIWGQWKLKKKNKVRITLRKKFKAGVPGTKIHLDNFLRLPRSSNGRPLRNLLNQHRERLRMELKDGEHYRLGSRGNDTYGNVHLSDLKGQKYLQAKGLCMRETGEVSPSRV